MKKMDAKRLKFGALATVITIFGIIAIFLCNLLAQKLEDRYGWSLDLTENERYALGEETQSVLSALNEDVDIYVLQSEGTLGAGSSYVVQAYKLLEEYERRSEHISVEYVDLASHPAFTARFPQYSLGTWDIVLECGDKTERTTFSELYEYDSFSGSVTASLVEQKITGALLSVSSSEALKVNVISGFSETLPGDLTALLKNNGYEVSETMLITGELDTDADMAILWAPERDMDGASLKKIENWLDNDGRQGRTFLLFLDPNHNGFTNLEAFAAEWGIAIRDGFAFEGNKNLYYQQPYYPIAQYGDMTYAKGMTQQDLTILALSRPVGTLFEKKDNFETDVLLTFTGTAGVLPPDAKTLTADMVTGDVDGMVLSTRTLYGAEKTESHMIVCGSALAFSGELITTDVFANGKYILGLLSSFANGQASVSGIVSKSLVSPVHSMTGGQTNTAVWVFMVILPLAILATGLIVFLRRRHK